MHSKIQSFSTHLKARRLATGTQDTYVRELSRFEAFCTQAGTPLLSAGRSQVEQYMARNDLASSTTSRRLVILRAFYSWLDHPLARALKDLRAPRTVRKIPQFLTEGEERRLRQVLKGRTDQRFRDRDRALLCLMLDTGLRVAEAVGLSVGDVDLVDKRVRLQTKGGKLRSKFLPAETRELLLPLVDQREDQEPLFEGCEGTRLSDRQVRRIVVHWTRLAGIQKHVHPHTLRHTFATSLLNRTQNLRLVQKAMDHESPSTTAIYAHVVDTELQAALEGRAGEFECNTSEMEG